MTDSNSRRLRVIDCDGSSEPSRFVISGAPHFRWKNPRGQIWEPESIVGSGFEGSIPVRDGRVYPGIQRFVLVGAEAELFLDSQDPLCIGIRE